MTRPASFDRELLAARSGLRAFCVKLTRDRARADDLVQDTLVKALTYWEQYTPGTKLASWLCIIARNIFFTQIRRDSRRDLIDLPFIFENDSNSPADAGQLALTPSSLTQRPNQEPIIFLQDVSRALDVAPNQREALWLWSAGNSYDEIADRQGVEVGTVKSRINRGREYLARACA